MSAKRIAFESEARDALLAGVRKLARAVKTTMGPRGRTVLLGKPYGPPHVTKDGVTVAREIVLSDALENMGALLAKEVALRAEQDAGDGTTTAIVLAEALLEEGSRQLAAGAEPAHLLRGVSAAARVVDEELRRSARPIASHQELTSVAASSANGDALVGAVVADALEMSAEGWVTIEEGMSEKTQVCWIAGVQLAQGFLSSHFATDAAAEECLLEAPYVLVHEGKLDSLPLLLPLLEEVAQEKAPLLIVAQTVEGEALAALVLNHLRGVVQVCAVKAPLFGERRKALLRDLAALTGARAPLDGLESEGLTLVDLGRADRVLVSRTKTTIMGGRGSSEDIARRVWELRRSHESAPEAEREGLEERISNLTGGVARIQVGANTEPELKERTERVRDALNTARAAREGGVVPGAGLCYLRAARTLAGDLGRAGDERLGVIALRRALETPLRQIIGNAGLSPGVFLEQSQRRGLSQAFDARSRELVDPTEAGIIDPLEVACASLRCAVSIASLLLATEASISPLDSTRP